jgi:hypothetical protein
MRFFERPSSVAAWASVQSKGDVAVEFNFISDRPIGFSPLDERQSRVRSKLSSIPAWALGSSGPIRDHVESKMCYAVST